MQSKEQIKTQIETYDKIIEELQKNQLERASNISEYTIDDKVAIVKTKYFNPLEIAKAIQIYTELKEKLMPYATS